MDSREQSRPAPEGPIRPADVGVKQRTVFPSFVFEAFNAEIAAKYVDDRAEVLQKDVIRKMMELGNIDRARVFAEGYLNVEEAYRAVGWSVRYDKPAYDESYDSFFVFKKKR